MGQIFLRIYRWDSHSSAYRDETVIPQYIEVRQSFLSI